jgi:alkanesulfonate monooxygenase SsuD/methylene tetrahydromethanopterin reductase-like flavin-dependent oxidoreductase (luciferase family)
MAKMTFGYLHDFRNPPQFRRPWDQYYGEVLDIFSHIETLGFDAGWVPEHHAAEDGYLPSPVVALSAIAARTKKLRLGSAVALAPFYHPVRFAEDCAVADIISGGRLEMTVALGYRRLETNAYGVDFKSRASRTDEFLEIVRRLWNGETFDYNGRHYQLKNASIMPRPVRGHIPLYVGGFGDKGLDRCVKYGDGYFGNIELCGLYQQKLKAAGKDPAKAKMLVLNIFMVVAEDKEKATAEIAPYLHHVNNVYGVWLNEDKYGQGTLQVNAVPEPMSLDDFKKSGLLQIKTPDEAIAYFKDVQAQAPVEHFMLMVPPGLPIKQFAPYAELFAKKVMPAFAK